MSIVYHLRHPEQSTAERRTSHECTQSSILRFGRLPASGGKRRMPSLPFPIPIHHRFLVVLTYKFFVRYKLTIVNLYRNRIFITLLFPPPLPCILKQTFYMHARKRIQKHGFKSRHSCRGAFVAVLNHHISLIVNRPAARPKRPAKISIVKIHKISLIKKSDFLHHSPPTKQCRAGCPINRRGFRVIKFFHMQMLNAAPCPVVFFLKA